MISTHSKDAVEFFAKKDRIQQVPAISMANSDLLGQVTDRLYRLRCRIVHTKAEGGPGEIEEVLLPYSAEAIAWATTCG